MPSSSNTLTHQLALAIELNHEATLSDFCWGNNLILKLQLEQLLQKKSDLVGYLWGNYGSGKSHLLQACCHSWNLKDSAIYLPLNFLKDWGPQVLEGIDKQSLVAIDDIDVIAGNAEWEEALFHLYNKIRDAKSSVLLISGQSAPKQSPIKLADLKSRLSWGAVILVNELTDELKIKTVQVQAKKRGFELLPNVVKFLLNRSSRNMHDLELIIKKLDNASLSAKRKVTLPFVKTILDL